MISTSVLKNDEKAIFRLRELYSGYGYSRYKVSKFEEYDLYAHNKSFLVSENVLTFTDTNGRLMALKPDVTLSIVKNISSEEKETQKLYYNENVYRTSPSSDGFREIMQTGLECIGNIDTVSLCEVVLLAKKSLEVISDDNILDISHMGFLMGFMEELGIDGAKSDKLFEMIGHKNIPAIKAFCADLGIDRKDTDDICDITSLYLPMEEALERIRGLIRGEKMRNAYEELCEICETLRVSGREENINVDFSTLNDRNYYNGVIFKGFVKGLPDSVLSGGRYDTLMRKMGKRFGAVGFAVYLDMLERLSEEKKDYDVDILLLYDSGSDALTAARCAEEYRRRGMSVRTSSAKGEGVKYKKLLKLSGEEVVSLEAND